MRKKLRADIKTHNLSANRYFHRLQKHFKSHLILRKTKITLYKILAKLLRLGHLQSQNDRALGLSERRILGNFFGAVMDKGQWIIRQNSELYEIYYKPELVKYCDMITLSIAWKLLDKQVSHY
jgi:hypothetical protein